MSAPDEATATLAVDAAARKAWGDARDRARAGGWDVPPAWDDLDKVRQRNLKEQVLPIVWAALEVVPSAAEVRLKAARELDEHANALEPTVTSTWLGGIREAAALLRGEVVR